MGKKAAVLNADGGIADMIEELTDLVDSLKVDAKKFDDANINAAATRVRVGLQDVKRASQEIRVEIQNRR